MSVMATEKELFISAAMPVIIAYVRGVSAASLPLDNSSEAGRETSSSSMSSIFSLCIGAILEALLLPLKLNLLTFVGVIFRFGVFRDRLCDPLQRT